MGVKVSPFQGYLSCHLWTAAFPRLTAEVHIKLFLRANSNLFIYWQNLAGKGQNRRHFNHSELESIIRRTEPNGESYLSWELGEEVAAWSRRAQPSYKVHAGFPKIKYNHGLYFQTFAVSEGRLRCQKLLSFTGRVTQESDLYDCRYLQTLIH